MRFALLLAGLMCTGFALAHDDVERDEDRRPGGDISHVNRGITIGARETAGDLSTVNGGIRIGEGAQVGDAETVNGGIRLDSGARARSLDTVNGGLRLGSNSSVERDAETVNGGIEMDTGAVVNGHVENVNGGVELDHARVGGGITTVNGDVTIGDGSVVEVGLKIEKPNASGWFNWGKQSKKPRVVIGMNAVVNGPLVFEREVDLYVHESAKIGAVTGATAQKYSGANPPQ